MLFKSKKNRNKFLCPFCGRKVVVTHDGYVRIGCPKVNPHLETDWHETMEQALKQWAELTETVDSIERNRE